jgi:hypothetical protein
LPFFSAYQFSASFKSPSCYFLKPSNRTWPGFSHTKIELSYFWDHLAKKAYSKFPNHHGKKLGKKEFLFHFFGQRQAMKFLKPNKIHLLYIYGNLDHFLQFCISADVNKKTGRGTTSQRQSDQNGYQLLPFNLSERHYALRETIY